MPESGTETNVHIKRVQRDYESGFNYKKIALHVAVARLIELFNLLKKESAGTTLQNIKLLLSYLYPFAASFSEEMWDRVQTSRGIKNTDKVTLSSLTLEELGIFDNGKSKEQDAPFKLMINSKAVSISLPSALVKGGGISQQQLADFLRQQSSLPQADQITRVIVNEEKRLVNILTSTPKPKK